MEGNNGNPNYALNTTFILPIIVYAIYYSIPITIHLSRIRINSSERYSRYGIGKGVYQETEFSDPYPLVYNELWQWPVVSADAVESYTDELGNIKYRSKIDAEGNKLVFKDEYKLTRLQASFKDNRAHKAIDISTSGLKYYVIAAYTGDVIKTNNTCGHISICNKDYCDATKQTYMKNGCGCGGNWGNYIAINSPINGENYTSVYAHLKLDSIVVGKDDHVNAGDIIAVVGSSGASGGPHLDFSIRTGSNDETIGKTYYDPILFNDMYVNAIYYPGGDDKAYKYKRMLMNIPGNIQNTCSSSICPDCKPYYEDIIDKYKK